MWPGRRGLRFTRAKEWGVVWKTYRGAQLGWRVGERCTAYLGGYIEWAEVDYAAWERGHGCWW